MSVKKALIIGVSGQDGSYLAQLLLEKGYEVVGTSRDAYSSSFSNLKRLGIKEQIKFETVSLTDFRSIIQILKNEKPDEIYNLSGQSSVGLSFKLPVEAFESISIATLNLLEAIRIMEMPVRLYNAGSSDCFGDIGDQPATEATLFQPKSPYAVAKAAAYWHMANYRDAYGLYAVTGLLFNHESPLRPERFVTKKIVKTACDIHRGIATKLKLGDISVVRDWGWAPEYVNAMWMMLQQEKPDDFIIATGESFSLEEFVTIVFDKLGMNWEKYTEFDSSSLRPADIRVSKTTPTKAKNILGWEAKYNMKDVAEMMVDAELEENSMSPKRTLNVN
jgi:GDPmannose 4,6-dehydratase